VRALLILAVIGALAACSDKTDVSATDKKGECIVPINPWTGDGGGHEAGFDWAQENHYECPSDHGQSFEEGCLEYYDQFNRYEACEAAKRK
jgi:hypothetical protein